MKKLIFLVSVFFTLAMAGQNVLTITVESATTYIINGSSSGDILIASEVDDNTVRLQNVTLNSSNDYKTTSGFTDFLIGGLNPSDIDDAVLRINAITGSEGVENPDNFTGGFANYTNSGGAQSITVLGSPVALLNDGLGAQTIKTFLPAGVTEVFNVSTNMFDWSQLKVGDMVDIRLDVTITTLSPNTGITVDLHLGGGAGSYVLPFISAVEIKTVQTLVVVRYDGIYIGDNNTLDNGGQFFMSTDKDCLATVGGFYIKIIKKG